VVTEPLSSYLQFLIVGLRGYEPCTRCLATARLEHAYFLIYFGPMGRMPHLSRLILIQSGKRGKWNYTLHGKRVMPEHTHIQTYIHFYIDRLLNIQYVTGRAISQAVSRLPTAAARFWSQVRSRGICGVRSDIETDGVSSSTSVSSAKSHSTNWFVFYMVILYYCRGFCGV
jgi:hypothetical protein